MSVTGLGELNRAIGVRTVEIGAAVLAASHEIAKLLEAYAKSHHPFQNRTGDTERTTTATVQEIGGVIQIVLLSKTPYAQYLELARGGKWAWLRDAVTENKAAINAILHGALGITGAFDGTYTVTAQDKRLHT